MYVVLVLMVVIINAVSRTDMPTPTLTPELKKQFQLLKVLLHE